MPEVIDGNTPPRMAPATALAFLLLGVSLLFAQQPHGALDRTRRWRCSCMVMGWLGLSRYMFGGEPLFAFADMAVHTAIRAC